MRSEPPKLSSAYATTRNRHWWRRRVENVMGLLISPYDSEVEELLVAKNSLVHREQFSRNTAYIFSPIWKGGSGSESGKAVTTFAPCLPCHRSWITRRTNSTQIQTAAWNMQSTQPWSALQWSSIIGIARVLLGVMGPPICHFNSHFPGNPRLAGSPLSSVSRDPYPQHRHRKGKTLNIRSDTILARLLWTSRLSSSLNLARLTQSTSSLCSTCPNHHNLTLLTDNLTGSSANIFLSSTFFFLKATHPSKHS